MPRLGVRAYPNRTMFYVVQTRAGGKIEADRGRGRHGVISPDQARRKAAQMIARIKTGEDRDPEATSQHLLVRLPSKKVQSWVGGANRVFHMGYSRRWCIGSLRNMPPAYC